MAAIRPSDVFKQTNKQLRQYGRVSKFFAPLFSRFSRRLRTIRQLQKLNNGAKRQQNNNRMAWSDEQRNQYIRHLLTSSGINFDQKQIGQLNEKQANALNAIANENKLNSDIANAVISNETTAQALSLLADNDLLANVSSELVQDIVNDSQKTKSVNELADKQLLTSQNLALLSDSDKTKALNHLADADLLDQRKINSIHTSTQAKAINYLADNDLLNKDNLDLMSDDSKLQAINRLGESEQLNEDNLNIVDNGPKAKLINKLYSNQLTADNISKINNMRKSQVRLLNNMDTVSQQDIDNKSPQGIIETSENESAAFMQTINTFAEKNGSEMSKGGQEQLNKLKQSTPQQQLQSIPYQLDQAGLLNEMNMRALFNAKKPAYRINQPLNESVTHRQTIIKALGQNQLMGQIHKLSDKMGDNVTNTGDLRAIAGAFKGLRDTKNYTDDERQQALSQLIDSKDYLQRCQVINELGKKGADKHLMNQALNLDSKLLSDLGDPQYVGQAMYELNAHGMDAQSWLQTINNHHQGDFGNVLQTLNSLSERQALNDSNVQAVVNKSQSADHKQNAWAMAEKLSSFFAAYNELKPPNKQLDTNQHFSRLFDKFNSYAEVNDFCQLAEHCQEQGVLQTDGDLEKMSNLINNKTEQGDSLLHSLNQIDDTQKDQKFYQTLLKAAQSENPAQSKTLQQYMSPRSEPTAKRQ